MDMKLLISALVSLLTAAALPAQMFSSGPQRVSLVELYTSEGCSSCPPAEEWLSGLRKNGDLWKTFVPIAFHVTYWNNLGWTDATSQNAFTERQRTYAAAWGSGSVYTPCFVRDGAEWRTRDLSPSGEKPGNLTLSNTGDGQVKVTFEPSKPGEYEVHLAGIGGQIETKVRSGENAGRTLRHDFVALSLQSAPLQDYRAVLNLPGFGKNPPPETGLVAWVTKRGELQPIQAVGGLLSK